MIPRLSDHFPIFGLVFYVLKSLGNLSLLSVGVMLESVFFSLRWSAIERIRDARECPKVAFFGRNSGMQSL